MGFHARWNSRDLPKRLKERLISVRDGVYHLRPHRKLAPFVQRVVIGQVLPEKINSVPATHQSLPDPYPELFWFLNGGFNINLVGGGEYTLRGAGLTGGLRRSARIEATESLEFISFPLKLGALARLGVGNVAEVRDQFVPLEEALSGSGFPEVFGGGESLGACLERLESFLLERFQADGIGSNDFLPYAINEIHRRFTDIKVQAIADEIGIPRRRLLRHFEAKVGVTPKELISVLRLRLAAHKIQQSSHIDLLDLAMSCGYCDQAHLGQDFRYRMGISPGNYRRNSA